MQETAIPDPKPRRRRNGVEAAPEIIPAFPDWTFELAGLANGKRLIAGCDEVGRGSWAGPLVAASVIFSPELIAASAQDPATATPETLELIAELADLEGVRDSKMIPEAKRDALDIVVRRHVLAAGVGIVSPALCDVVGMGAANRLAMLRAVRGLGITPDLLLLDAFKLPLLKVPQQSIIKGDARCMTIAASSIVAKVARDNMMSAYEADWPAYGFAKHKGYGTAEHATALFSVGPCPLHRRCFAPVREALKRQ